MKGDARDGGRRKTGTSVLLLTAIGTFSIWYLWLFVFARPRASGLVATAGLGRHAREGGEGAAKSGAGAKRLGVGKRSNLSNPIQTINITCGIYYLGVTCASRVGTCSVGLYYYMVGQTRSGTVLLPVPLQLVVSNRVVIHLLYTFASFAFKYIHANRGNKNKLASLSKYQRRCRRRSTCRRGPR